MKRNLEPSRQLEKPSNFSFLARVATPLALVCGIMPDPLAGQAPANMPGTLQVQYSPAHGIGLEAGVMRRDPSDIIKVGDRYYVWYSKGNIRICEPLTIAMMGSLIAGLSSHHLAAISSKSGCANSSAAISRG